MVTRPAPLLYQAGLRMGTMLIEISAPSSCVSVLGTGMAGTRYECRARRASHCTRPVASKICRVDAQSADLQPA